MIAPLKDSFQPLFLHKDSVCPSVFARPCSALSPLLLREVSAAMGSSSGAALVRIAGGGVVTVLLIVVSSGTSRYDGGPMR
jgi:hypothetical protein